MPVYTIQKMSTPSNNTGTHTNSVWYVVSVIGIILIGICARFIPHPPNVTPLGGLALFSGVSLSFPLGLFIPLITMFISDLVLGLHPTIPYVYGSFLLITMLGRHMKNKISVIHLTGLSVLSSLIFFLITNFGAWLTWDFYPKTISGLISSYVMALPFFRNSLLGDLFFSIFFFYSHTVFLHFFQKKYIIAEKSH